jgi:integrase
MGHGDFTGIQSRVDKAGVTRYRGRVKDRGKWVPGPWRTSLADARGDRIRMQARKLDGPLRAEGGQTLTVASERFLAGIESGDILSRWDRPYAHSTVRGYRYAFRDFILPELGHVAVDKLRRSQVQRWVDWLSPQVGAGSTRNVFHALAALYSYLLPRHDGLVSPTDHVKIPRAGKPRDHIAQPHEVGELLAALPPELALPYAIAFYAGLRRGEIQALRDTDVDGQWVHVSRSLDRVQGFKTPKNGRPRSVPIFEPLRPFLAALPSGLIFPSAVPTRWGVRDFSTLADKAAKVWRAAGLTPVGIHEARHSFATALVRARYDVAQVSEWVGHGNAATTLNVYVKPQRRELRGPLVDPFNLPVGQTLSDNLTGHEGTDADQSTCSAVQFGTGSHAWS